jgi:hypothetical protein
VSTVRIVAGLTIGENVSVKLCYYHNLGRMECGPWSKMGLKDSYNGLANQTLYKCFGPMTAVYLDKYA